MIHIETKIKIPFLWGKNFFKKDEWSQVNLIVGPNGSGKTLLAKELANQFEQKGYKVSFLKAERKNQEKLLNILKENIEIKTKIETILSNMFGKSIRFEKTIDGRFIPIVINKTRGVEYNLKDGECHGLKEILTLLISLYSIKSGCLFLDEPELHLHPQVQQFFMNEIRKLAKEDSNKIFFLITHSPYFIDLNLPEDLIGVIVCHVNKTPTSINKLNEEDESLFRRFLPRFNTYHKQFFFSDNQIFVEGYTDQQMFSHLLDCIENHNNSAGTGIIDVGGKDELGVFFKVCSLLGTDGRIITDLDALFCGKLRDVVCEDERPARWLEKQEEKQIHFFNVLFTKKELQVPVTLEKLIMRLEKFLIDIGKYIYKVNYSISPKIDLFTDKVKCLYDKYEKPEGLDTFKTVILMGVINLKETLADSLPVPLAVTVPQIINLTNIIMAAIECARVYILPKGCIEHYYVQSIVDYMPISSKDRLFHTELEYLINETEPQLKKEYSELISILNKACLKEQK